MTEETYKEKYNKLLLKTDKLLYNISFYPDRAEGDIRDLSKEVYPGVPDAAIESRIKAISANIKGDTI